MTSGKKVVPTSTTLQARVMLYQPTQRPRQREGDWFQTSFGRCRVTGRLGQRHQDVIEAILYCAERNRKVGDGIELLADPAKVRRILSDNGYSYSQIDKLLTECRAATIEIVTPELENASIPIIGGLIDHVKPSIKTRRDPLTGGERELWVVRLGIALVMLLEKDLSLYYNPAPIARLKHGITQAVVRHILTHKHTPKGGWFIDTLITAVAGPLKGQPLWDARRRLRDEAKSFNQFGYEIEGKRVKATTQNLAHPPDNLAHPPGKRSI